MKGGVTVVAVKRLNNLSEPRKALFAKEMEMLKYVSRVGGWVGGQAGGQAGMAGIAGWVGGCAMSGG